MNITLPLFPLLFCPPHVQRKTYKKNKHSRGEAQQEKNSSKKMIFNAFQFLKNKNKLIYFTLQHFWKHF